MTYIAPVLAHIRIIMTKMQSPDVLISLTLCSNCANRTDDQNTVPCHDAYEHFDAVL